MKKFSKVWLTKVNLLIVSNFIISCFVRFYNFPNRITFWSEQARSLVVTAEYLKKPSLLGQEYFRVDSYGHKIFSGAIFNYSLLPLYLLSKDPQIITIYFTLLNVFTGGFICLLVKRIYNQKIAIVSTTLFLFSGHMIYHSLFIWNYNYLPLLGLFAFYLFNQIVKKHFKRHVFLLGLVSGLAVSIQILLIPFVILMFGGLLLKSNKKLQDIAVFLPALLLGNFPMVIFDLRHDFYQTKTLLRYLQDTLIGKSDAGISYYYFLPFWPVAATFVARYLVKLKISYLYLIIGIYVFINLRTPLVRFNMPTGMPSGIIVKDIDLASQKIAENASGEFNVSEVLDFDKRAYVLRYFVEYKYGKAPQSEIKYDGLDELYVLSENGFDFKKSGVWEINTGGPYNISKLTDVGTGYSIYKLQK